MGSVVERDGQLGFELVIDLTASRVEAVEAMRPRDGSLLHGAPVDLRMSWPRRLTVVPTRCDQYGPSFREPSSSAGSSSLVLSAQPSRLTAPVRSGTTAPGTTSTTGSR